jgi:trans-2,3-dihydro-3-hydroxyanthranilate isomerase
MKLPFHTLDVFTRTRFGGNPLAVVLDADALTTEQMQAIAREFNYSETTFVLRPRSEQHSAHVRIFTPTVEVPFAGHPNVGTAYALATAEGAEAVSEFTFEEAAGLVPVRILRVEGKVDRLQLTAPQALSIGRSFAPASVAACLSLAQADIASGVHPPCIASVGLPFLVVEVATRAALRRAKPDMAAFSTILPADGADAIYLYCRELQAADGAVDFTARMFAPSTDCRKIPPPAAPRPRPAPSSPRWRRPRHGASRWRRASTWGGRACCPSRSRTKGPCMSPVPACP